MRRALFFLACVATFHVVMSGDSDEPTKQEPTTLKPIPPTTEPSCCCGGRHPPKCGKNEVYDDCRTTNCRPTRCSDLGNPSMCNAANRKCKPGCKCKDGYVYSDKTDKDVCIPVKDCRTCGNDENAEYGCGNNCGKMCGDNGKPVACSQACVVNGCDCRDGFYYNPETKKCGRKEDCPRHPPKCGKNEVYDDCRTTNCYPTRCSDLGKPSICNAANRKCKPGCKCKDGYVYSDKTDKDLCIPVKDCRKCGNDTNAQYGCGNNCGKMCGDNGKPVACSQVCVVNGCDCRDGFYYNPETKKCGRKEDCPRHPPKCGKNEVYDDCRTTNCYPTRCSDLGKPSICNAANRKCKPGCKCKDGYVYSDKSDKDVCIPVKDCRKCGNDENAEYGCGNNCGKMCGDNGKPVACSQVCVVNGCDCRDGFYYNPETKKCGRKEDCPTPICKENEEYNPCSNGGCGPKNCSQMNHPYVCIDPIFCVKGCVCKDGYLRDDATYKCIPKHQCPKLPPKCKKNEVYDNCTNTSCRPTSCSQVGYPLHCDEKCKPGCKCKDNYVLNDKRVCIPIRDCKICGGDHNATAGCGTNCNKTCDSIGKKIVACPLFCKLNGCDCRDGFYFNSKTKTCVRKEDCPKTCPGQNEYYDECFQNCGSQNCSDQGKIYHCPLQQPGKCDSSGCRCKPGYMRNATYHCILKKDCPPPECPPNQRWEPCPTVKCEGDNCPKTKDSPQTCPVGIVCDQARCMCIYNHKKAANGSCIPISKCPPFKCGKYEDYKACPDGCPGEKCSDYINKTKCPPYRIGIVVNCRPACKCKKGYYRDGKRNCILARDCPVATTTQKPPMPEPAPEPAPETCDCDD